MSKTGVDNAHGHEHLSALKQSFSQIPEMVVANIPAKRIETFNSLMKFD
jgi:hypothetical protein